LEQGILNCNLCKSNKPVTDEMSLNQDKICRTFCNKGKDNPTCKFYEYVIKIDKKTMDPKILNAFGLNGLRRLFKRNVGKKVIVKAKNMKPPVKEDANKPPMDPSSNTTDKVKDTKKTA
jgi:hypothetical protein